MTLRTSASPVSSIVIALFAVGGTVLAACGGAADSALFDGAGGVGSSPDASASGNGGDDTSSPAPAHDSGASPPSSSKDSGTSSPSDASTTGNQDSAPPATDSAVPPPSATIACDVSKTIQTCDAATSVCCRVTDNGGNGGGNDTYSCVLPSDCTPGNNTLPIPCDDADDCAAQGSPSGTVCCVTEDVNSGLAVSIGCVAASACDQPTQTWMCQGTGVCPNNEPCSTSSSTIPGYDICRK